MPANAMHSRRSSLERLEDRRLFSVAAAYYSLDGSGNNLAHPAWGSTNTDLLRKAGTAYGDGISSMAGADRPNPRELSNILGTQLTDPEPNSRNMSDMIYAWGQFLDHDLDLTPTGTEDASITVPAGDTVFTPGSVIPTTRDISDPATGTSTANPRQNPNTITSFLDGSMIYGSDPARAMALRTGVGGMMKTSPGDLLPFNTADLPDEIHIPGTDPTTLFVAGDVRVNENSELAALQVLFLREHNYWAGQFAAAHPDWGDQTLYDHARQRVIAEIQSITYNEFLPALLGTGAMSSYTGYKANVNPGISAEFSTAAYRVGHTLVNGNIDFFNNDGSESHDPVDFNASADSPAVLEGGPGFVGSGVDQIMKYLVADNAQEVDNQFEGALRNQLFAPTGTVFHDTNHDGVLDPGERGAAGQVVLLLDASNKIVVRTHTAANGSYRFDTQSQNAAFTVYVPPRRGGASSMKEVSLVDNSGAGQFGVDLPSPLGRRVL